MLLTVEHCAAKPLTSLLEEKKPKQKVHFSSGMNSTSDCSVNVYVSLMSLAKRQVWGLIMNPLSQTSCVRSPSTPVFPLGQTCVNHWAIALFFSLFFFASKIHHSLTALILATEWTHQSPHWLHCEGDRMHPKPRQCLVLLFTLMHILSLVRSQGKTLQIERRCSSTCGLIAILAFVLGFFGLFVFSLSHTLHSWTIQAKPNVLRWQFRHQQPGRELPRSTERESQLQGGLQWFLQNDLLRRPVVVQRQQMST